MCFVLLLLFLLARELPLLDFVLKQFQVCFINVCRLFRLHVALDLAGQSALEVSGNRTLDDVKNLPGARDLFLSAGALTKHVQAIDLSLRLG